jgi:NADH-quinone oxidoreductase subunit J
MTEQLPAITFYVLSFAALGGAVSMMATRNVVHAAFWLLEVMLATAGIYLLLSAEFLALVQVLVYAGAVSVLVLFTIMLTLRRREDAIRPFEPGWTIMVLVALFGGAVAFAITRAPLAATATLPERAPDVAAFGTLLFTRWLVPFEAASLVLLVALIGAVWWSGGDGS